MPMQQDGKAPVADDPSAAPEGAVDAAAPEAVARAHQLAAEIHELRTTLRHISETFLARVDGRLAGVERALGGRGHAGRFVAVPPDDVVEHLARQVAKVKLKPRRGRLKDLARLKQLARALAAALLEPPEER